MACWGWTVYQASCIPPQAAQPETDHEAYVRRTNEKREAERRESEQFTRTGR